MSTVTIHSCLISVCLAVLSGPAWAQDYQPELPPLPPPPMMTPFGFAMQELDPIPTADVGDPVTIDFVCGRLAGATDQCAAGMTRLQNTLNNSQLGHITVRLLSKVQSKSASTGSASSDLSQATTGYNGFAAEILAERDRVGADCMIVLSTVRSACGVAYLTAHAGTCVAVVADNCISNSSYEHEVGHTAGLAHDMPNGGDGGYAGASYGHCATFPSGAKCGHKDVMVYPSPCGGTRVARFSNSKQFCPTHPTAAFGSLLSDGAWAWLNRAPVMAAFRQATDVGTPPPPPGPSIPEGWPDDGITVTDDASAAALRASLIQQIWQCPGLPTRVASSVQTNVPASQLQSPIDLPNIQRVDRYTIRTYGQSLHTWLIHPNVSSGALSVVVLGHTPSGTLTAGSTSPLLVAEALRRGQTVLVVPMPFNGASDATVHHDALGTQAYPGFSPLHYFLDTPIVALNTYLANNPTPTQITAMGVSGGGWTTVLWAALDTRIQQSFEVAGTLPLPLRTATPPGDIGDWEQRLPALTAGGAQLDYLDLYLMGVSDGRTQLQLHNELDTCCFWGTRQDSYATTLESLNPRWNFQRVQASGVHGVTAAQVSTHIGSALGPIVIVQPARTICDNGDACFTTTGTGWSNSLTGRPSYQNDAHFVCGTGTGERRATWTFPVSDADAVVWITWRPYENRSLTTPFAVLDAAGTVLASTTINQQLAPVGTVATGGMTFQTLATVRTATGSVRVQMTDATTGCVIADAALVDQ